MGSRQGSFLHISLDLSQKARTSLLHVWSGGHMKLSPGISAEKNYFHFFAFFPVGSVSCKATPWCSQSSSEGAWEACARGHIFSLSGLFINET